MQVKLHRIALSDRTAEIPFADRSMKVSQGMKSEIVQAIPFDELAKKENIHLESVIASCKRRTSERKPGGHWLELKKGRYC